MQKLTINLIDTDFQRLEQAAKREGKSVQNLIYDWIHQLPTSKELQNITADPLFQMEGYNADVSPDLSTNIDNYIYGGN